MMRQSATSFTSLLGNRLGLVGPSHHASQDAIQTETPGSSCLTPLPDATTDCPTMKQMVFSSRSLLTSGS